MLKKQKNRRISKMEGVSHFMAEKISEEVEILRNWPSNSQFPFTFFQVKDAFTDIKKYLLLEGELTILLPKADNVKDLETLHNLHARLQEYGANLKRGLVHVTKSLTVLLNLESIDVPCGIHWEMILILPDRPCTILCITDDINDLNHKRYILQVTRNVMSKLRKFTSEHVSGIYGLIGKEETCSYSAFSKRLTVIEEDTSQFCHPDSLYMTVEKCESITKAFIVSIAATDLVTVLRDEESEKDTLWFLTLQQFQALVKNIDRDLVVLETVQGSGSTLLLVEVGRRLSKIGSTMLTVWNEMCAKLRKRNFSQLIFTPDQMMRKIQKNDVRFLVAEGISAEDMQKIKALRNNLSRIWIVNPDKVREEQESYGDLDVADEGDEEGYESAVSDFEEDYHSSHEDGC